MGDSRSWAADMEDEIKTCKFGVKSRYFDKCTCSGCTALSERNSRIQQKINDVKYAAQKVFQETPDDLWHTIKSIKIK